MDNPLTSKPRRSAGKVDIDHCPDRYAQPAAWCAWRNREKTRNDIMWIVGANGTPILVDDEAVCAERSRKDRDAKAEEARRHNHRIMHPVTEQGRAA